MAIGRLRARYFNYSQSINFNMISDTGLDKFIKLYKEKNGVELNRQEAFNLFFKLINLTKFVYGEDK